MDFPEVTPILRGSLSLFKTHPCQGKARESQSIPGLKLGDHWIQHPSPRKDFSNVWSLLPVLVGTDDCRQINWTEGLHLTSQTSFGKE